jgi:hypothetical protein
MSTVLEVEVSCELGSPGMEALVSIGQGGPGTHLIRRVPDTHWIGGGPGAYWAGGSPSTHWVEGPGTLWAEGGPGTHWIGRALVPIG